MVRARIERPAGSRAMAFDFLLAALAALALFLLLAGCASSQEEQQGGSQEEEEPVTGEFVGEASGANNAFLALVAEKPFDGEQTREVRAYLCDGEGISEWFVGQASANDFELSSEESGARLTATLSEEGEASGTLTLSEGESSGFEARPAEGIEGFYPVTVTPEGLVSGASWRGARLEGRRVGERISGTIVPPDAEQPVPFGVTVPGVEEGEYRWIFFDGRLKGAKKGRSAGFISSDVKL